jgi:hypothetical protein
MRSKRGLDDGKPLGIDGDTASSLWWGMRKGTDDDDEHGRMIENECSRHGDDQKCVPNEPWMGGIHQGMTEIWHGHSEGGGGGGMSYLNIEWMDLGDRGVDGKAYWGTHLCQSTKGWSLIDPEISPQHPPKLKISISPEPWDRIGQVGARIKGLVNANMMVYTAKRCER